MCNSDCPNNRAVTSNKRAVGLKLLLCAIALLLGATVHAQPVPDTIVLPDSLGPLHRPFHLASGGSSGDIYVASESSDIIVVDGNTFQRMKRINTGTSVGGVLLVAGHDKLYCSYPKQGRIGVIDCATNSIVGSIEVGTRPTLLCYSSGSDKLYCGDTIDRTVTVIDCAADTVLRVISVGESLTAMAYDPTTGKVYAATRDAVLAISCPADSVVARLDDIRSSRGLCINKRRQKLYAVGPLYQYPDTLYVISTGTDSLTAKIKGLGDPLPRLACNEATDRLYAVSEAGGWYILEFDCVGDTLRRVRAVDDVYGRALVCDTVRNRLYHLLEGFDGGVLYSFDCVTLQLLTGTRVENDPVALELDPVRRRVLCAGGGREAVLSVFDCDRDSLQDIAATPLSGWSWRGAWGALCHNPVSAKLYYPWGNGSGGVGVIDEQTNRVVRHVILPQDYGVTDLAYSPTSNKLYCALSSGLAVLDGSSDSLLKLIELGDYVPHLCWYPGSNKLYCYVKVISGLRLYIAVLDCYTDSVVREIEVEDRILIDKLEYLDNGRLLCVRRENLRLIDCRTDSVVVDTPFDGNIYAVTHTGDGKKVYAVHHYTYDRLDVLDASSLSLLTTVDWHFGGQAQPTFLVCSESTHKLYWFAPDPYGAEQDSILVIDTRSDAVVARLKAGFRQNQGCLDRSGRYIFCPDVSNNSLIVYDTQSDSLAAVYTHLPGPFAVTPNPELGSIYVWCSDVVLVYPDAPAGVEESMNDERGAMNTRAASIVRGILFLHGATSLKPQAASLMNVSGRRVMGLRPGANDVRALPPGVYFVRENQAQAQAQAIRKVVIAR